MRADLDTTLAALADPARRRVVHLLSERPRRSSELARALAVSRPAMSRHLRVLRHAGIVEQEVLESDTRVRMVQLRREPFTALRAWVEDLETFWSGQLDAFRDHVEKRPLRTQHRQPGHENERTPRSQRQASEESVRKEQQRRRKQRRKARRTRKTGSSNSRPGDRR